MLSIPFYFPSMKRMAIGLIFVWLGGCHTGQTLHAPSEELRVGAGIPIGDLDPSSSSAGIGSNLMELVHPVIFRLSETGGIVPDFAKEIFWDSTKGKLRVVLNSDHADELIKAIKRIQALTGGHFQEGMRHLSSIEKKSSKEVIFHLEKPDRAFLFLFSILPIEAGSPKDSNIGPFELESNLPQELVLRRKVHSPDKVNRIRIKVIPSPRRAIRELVAGNIDLLIFASHGDYQVLDDLTELQVAELSTRMLYQVVQNRSSSKNHDDANLGKLNKIIDRDSLIKSLNPKEFTAAYHTIPPGDPLYKLKLNTASSDVSGERSIEQLNKTLSFLGFQSKDRSVARLLKRRMEELNIQLELRSMTPQEFESEIYLKKNFDWVLLPINIKDSLVTNYLAYHSPEGANSLNFSGYRNPDFDQLIEKARYAKDDFQAKTAFGQAIEKLVEQPPGLFLFWVKTPIVYRKSCSGFKLNAAEFFSSLKDVRCEPYAQN